MDLPSLLKRLGWNILLHAALFGIGVFLIGLASNRSGIIRADLLTSLGATDPDTLSYYVERASGRVRLWWAASGVISLVLTSIWLVAANLVQPAGDRHAASRAAGWWFTLVAALAAWTAYGWYIFVFDAGATVLNGGFVINIAAVGLLAGLAIFYLGTAFAVKPSMRPSVPLANLWLP